MSCKSAIYTVNSTSTPLAIGATVPLGTTIRRFGNNIQLSGSNGIVLAGVGYYDVAANLSVTAAAAGVVTATLYADGVAVPGATATETVSAAGDIVNLSINSLVRLVNCTATTLTIVLSGTTSTTTNNIAVVVKKV